jgi:hypothetical protein
VIMPLSRCGSCSPTPLGIEEGPLAPLSRPPASASFSPCQKP